MIAPMLEQRIEQHFIDSADLNYQVGAQLSPSIAAAVEALLTCVTSGGKVLACGDGSSLASAQHFVNTFIGRFERERPELAAQALSADAGLLFGPDGAPVTDFYARQVRALGHAGDVLLTMASSGQPQSVLSAVEAAHERDMVVVGVSAGETGIMELMMRDTDILINLPAARPARIHEMQVLVVHCLCDGVDVLLLGDPEGNS
jgi:D-sedoheptulose 7-phosphate isomerase